MSPCYKTTDPCSRRVNIRAILDTPHLRRELMVEAIVAIQNREGIETTREQAEKAYDKVLAERSEQGDGMRCPLCNRPEGMHIWWGPDGTLEGVQCILCRRQWYSNQIADKVRIVIGHAVRGVVETQPFPEDARQAGEYGSDPQYDQQELGNGDWIWLEPDDDEVSDRERHGESGRQTKKEGSDGTGTEGTDESPMPGPPRESEH